MKKLAALALAALLLAGGSASAYDIGALAAGNLSKNFTYTDIPGTQTLHFGGGEIPYHMGQLSIIRKKPGNFPPATLSRPNFPKCWLIACVPISA